MDQYKNNNSSLGWITMSEAARLVPYSAEYLSLLARKKKLPAKKINDVWYTTQTALEEYVNRQILRNHIYVNDQTPPNNTHENKFNQLTSKTLNVQDRLGLRLKHGFLSEEHKDKTRTNVTNFLETLENKSKDEIFGKIDQLSSSLRILSEK